MLTDYECPCGLGFEHEHTETDPPLELCPFCEKNKPVALTIRRGNCTAFLEEPDEHRRPTTPGFFLDRFYAEGVKAN